MIQICTQTKKHAAHARARETAAWQQGDLVACDDMEKSNAQNGNCGNRLKIA